MISDSIPNASIPMASSSNHKDFSKKKRANRSAKLKQCKLDVRREQWLSQVKNKGGRNDTVDGGGQLVHGKSERVRPIDKIGTKIPNGEETYGDRTAMHHYSDVESSPPNSPNSHTSSILGSNDSAINFSVSSRSGQSCSSSNKSLCSENMSEEYEVDDGDDSCVDDWEAMADALAATDMKQQEHITNSEFVPASSEKYEDDAESISKAKLDTGGTTKQRAVLNSRAWRPDDAYRPQGLPNLTKQFSFPLNSERQFGCGGSVWGCRNLGLIPTPCPICFEDLDYTDSSFLPCSCGFRLCLFCHKKILEGDGRCPGCRKQYEHDPVEGEAIYDGGSFSFRLARTCSMFTRS